QPLNLSATRERAEEHAPDLPPAHSSQRSFDFCGAAVGAGLGAGAALEEEGGALFFAGAETGAGAFCAGAATTPLPLSEVDRLSVPAVVSAAGALSALFWV